MHWIQPNLINHTNLYSIGIQMGNSPSTALCHLNNIILQSRIMEANKDNKSGEAVFISGFKIGEA